MKVRPSIGKHHQGNFTYVSIPNNVLFIGRALDTHTQSLKLSHNIMWLSRTQIINDHYNTEWSITLMKTHLAKTLESDAANERRRKETAVFIIALVDNGGQ